MSISFVAIDFETANYQPNSACQLAAVVVRENEIVEEYSWLIRPPRLYFAPKNIQIHGIRPEHVQDAPTMEQVWSELQPIMDGHLLIAHNARFDIGVLTASLAAHDVCCPEFEFSCTRVLARAAWPGRKAYGLKPLADSLGISFKHHDALEDARACALICSTICSEIQSANWSEIESELNIARGKYRYGEISSPRGLKARRGMSRDIPSRTVTDRFGFPAKGRAKHSPVVDVSTIMECHSSSDQLPLAEKRIVMLGPLRGMSMTDTLTLLTSMGAFVQQRPDRTTHYVVACGTTLEDANQLLTRQSHSSTEESSNDLSLVSEDSTEYTSAKVTRVLSERQFLSLLPGGLASLKW